MTRLWGLKRIIGVGEAGKEAVVYDPLIGIETG